MKLLEINNLAVNFNTYGGEVKAVRDVSLEVNEGEVLAIVGESGSGKSVTAQSIMGLIPTPPGRIQSGEIVFKGENLLEKTKKEMRRIKGSEISMVFQDPMTSLNPTMKIGKQIEENLLAHKRSSRSETKKRAIELLRLVEIPDPETRYNQYPHEFSGGMRQRVMIAIALACEPSLLIADEPTTALDVTIQAQVLELMKNLQERLNTSIILITHDLGVVAEMAETVGVMYAGMLVEKGSVEDIFENSAHPYTWGLMESIPDVENDEGKRLVPIKGSPPDLFSPPEGCPFAPRCKYAMEICLQEIPPEFEMNEQHTARCWLNHPHAPKLDELVTRSDVK